jgi:hypothetical protein
MQVFALVMQVFATWTQQLAAEKARGHTSTNKCHQAGGKQHF